MRHLPFELIFSALCVMACAAPVEKQDNSELLIIGGDDEPSETEEDGRMIMSPTDMMTGGTQSASTSTGGSIGTTGGVDGSGGAPTGGSTNSGGNPASGGSIGAGGSLATGGSSSGGTSSGGGSSGGSSNGGTSSGGSSSGGSSSGGAPATICTALVAGAHDVSEQWWAGDSEGVDQVVAPDGRGISDPTGIPGLDQWDGPTGWANLTYAFGPESECRDASGLTTISVDVTSVAPGEIRISLMTEATQSSSNHFALLETFVANETKTIMLSLDGSNLQSSWLPAEAWDPEHLISIIAIPLAADMNGLAPYDISMSNIVVQ